jgi:N,N-dimethylformamidase beta subunit-like protein
VTEDEYDTVTEFRDRGGKLAFLSANNFFWKIRVRGRTMTRVAKWRDLGRPEAALLGVQYRANDRGGHRSPWLVRSAPASRWLFAGVQLRNGREFSSGNVEIDATASSSPPDIQVVAEIPDLLGPGLTAQMTYYETRNGAQVFAAGAFSLARNVPERPVQQLLANLWRRLAQGRAP